MNGTNVPFACLVTEIGAPHICGMISPRPLSKAHKAQALQQVTSMVAQGYFLKTSVFTANPICFASKHACSTAVLDRFTVVLDRLMVMVDRFEAKHNCTTPKHNCTTPKQYYTTPKHYCTTLKQISTIIKHTCFTPKHACCTKMLHFAASASCSTATRLKRTHGQRIRAPVLFFAEYSGTSAQWNACLGAHKHFDNEARSP